MPFHRVLLPQEPSTETLTGAMVGIGMNFAAPAIPNANIEDTIFFASIEGMEHDDLRVLSVLVQWLSVHLHLVNMDRLTKLVEDTDHMRTRAFWAALSLKSSDPRFWQMGMAYLGRLVNLLENSNFQIKRKDEDPRFSGTTLCVPANTLREREGDVLSPDELAQRHRAYHFRTIMGPSYRADAWAALEQDPSLSTTELARKSYCAFATAWQVKRDFLLSQAAPNKPSFKEQQTAGDAALAARTRGLPPLTGIQAQIEWATTLRETLCVAIDAAKQAAKPEADLRDISRLEAFVQEETRAQRWIGLKTKQRLSLREKAALSMLTPKK